MPAAGGEYREGVVAATSRERDAMVDALTKVGLVRRGVDKTIQPALASSWVIAPDAQSISLTLIDRVHAADIVTILKEQTGVGYWKDVDDIAAPDDHTLTFHLPRPWAGFVYELTTPLFLYGPYEKNVKESDQNKLVFTPNPQALISPYLSKVVVHFFPDSHSANRALRKNSLDAIFLSEEDESIVLPSEWEERRPVVDREHILFFNIREDLIKDVSIRQKLIKNEPLASPINVRLVYPDTPLMQAMATNLKVQWEPLGATINLESYPTLTLTKTVIPEHNYDLLLLGIDYGADGDLFPYWHSSQMASPGLNLAGYRNKDVDKLLEDARKTLDEVARAEISSQARQLIERDAAFLSLGSPQVVYNRNFKIHGAVPEVFSEITDRWLDLPQWYQKTKRIPKQ